jgi:hypothetical protein
MRQQGLTEDNYQLFAYQVYRGAFERTAIRIAAIDAVQKAGCSVTDDWLDKKVAENAAFQEDGKFSAEKYHAATLSEKLTVRNQIRDDYLYQAYFSDLLSIGPSSKEIAFVKDMAKSTRTIEYAAFPLSKYPDAEVESWGRAHADLFRSLMLSRVTITSSEDDATKLLKNIQAKTTTFEAVAKASSKDAYSPKGGSEGPKYFNELSSELATKVDADKLATLKVGDLSGATPRLPPPTSRRASYSPRSATTSRPASGASSKIGRSLRLKTSPLPEPISPRPLKRRA